MTELLLVRHGQSQFNAERRWENWVHESPLTPHGEGEARVLADRLVAEHDIAALYASPLTRAAQTAQIIGKALGMEPRAFDGLREIDVGLVGGLTRDGFEARFPSAFARWQDRRDMDFAWPGGEVRSDFFQRATQAVAEIVAKHPGDKVVVVCHGGVIRATLAFYLPNDFSEWWAYALHTGSLSRLLVSPDGNRLVTLNEYEEGVAAASTLRGPD
jgi:probable phosphoglycerate mutase